MDARLVEMEDPQRHRRRGIAGRQHPIDRLAHLSRRHRHHELLFRMVVARTIEIEVDDPRNGRTGIVEDGMDSISAMREDAGVPVGLRVRPTVGPDPYPVGTDLAVVDDVRRGQDPGRVIRHVAAAGKGDGHECDGQRDGREQPGSGPPRVHEARETIAHPGQCRRQAGRPRSAAFADARAHSAAAGLSAASCLATSCARPRRVTPNEGSPAAKRTKPST